MDNSRDQPADLVSRYTIHMDPSGRAKCQMSNELWVKGHERENTHLMSVPFGFLKKRKKHIEFGSITIILNKPMN